MFSHWSSIFIFFLSFLTFFFCSFFAFFKLSFNYMMIKGLDNFFFSFNFNTIVIFFIFMVVSVGFLIFLYSEFYFAGYSNMFIFNFFLCLFFLSMFILISSDNFLVLMMGWDFLGVSSILLIMFYANKTTFYNSILTMIFNRVGDVILMFVVSLFFFNLVFNNFCNFSYDYFCLMLLCFCCLTKSAQFPFSSWLPAAMSAPTPISALVHSSTLVTAGIFLSCCFFSSVFDLDLVLFVSSFCVSTFLIGGFLCVMELDLKKMIAFSTLSQISFIFFCCFVFNIFLGLTHMFFHAIFKSGLFCLSGMIFLKVFGDQLFKNSFLMGSTFISSGLFFFLFSMSGLIFSCSFFSKDLIIEMSFSSSLSHFYSFILLIGSVFTILYCLKIFFICFSSLVSYFSFNFNNFNSLIFFFYMTFSLLVSFFFKFFCFNFSGILVFSELIFVNLLFFSVFFYKFNFFYNNFFFNFSYHISYMKFVTFSFLGNFFFF